MASYRYERDIDPADLAPRVYPQRALGQLVGL